MIEDEINISPEFYFLLKQYTKSDDPLEDPNFDIVAYLNEKFTDFKSLDKLPGLIDDFEKQIGELDEEIDNLMCERASYNDEMKSYMTELNNDVSKIIELVNRIKTNTDINETTVRMICNDIKNLDNARNNITTTISSLTKLIILITGIEKLETFVKSKSFKESANAISASKDILEYFKEYMHVTQVNQLYQKKENLCTILLGSILDEFKNNLGLLPNNCEQLYEACLAINAIGDSAIKALKTWFTQYKLTPYEEIFDPKISNEFQETERRFEWLKRVLKDYNMLYENVFLPSWGFKSQLCQEFCRITKLHLNEILMMNLDEGNSKKRIEVDVLVRVLNNTISFENNLHTYLISDFENVKNNYQNSNITLSLQGIKMETSNLEEIKAKYEANDNNFFNNPNRIDPNSEPKYSLFRVKGIISESFEPYMISYVNIEEKKLKGIIDDLKMSDRIEGKLLVSSLHLFNNIKQAMTRCLTFSRSKTFFDLSRKFKDVFEYYNEKILYNNKIRINTIDKEKIKLSDEDLKYICYIINTSDYCITTISSLVESLKDKIDEKYKNQICYDDTIDFIKLTYKNSFELIMQHMRNFLNENFNSMTKLALTNTNPNHDIHVSQFVIVINKYLENIFFIFKDILQENLLYHLLNSTPNLITSKFIENLYKIKKLDETGAQKLLMDNYELKGIIIKIYNNVNPNANKENDFNLLCLTQAMKIEFSKIESRLKCLGSNLNEFGNAYKTFVEDKSKDDFDKLLNIRSIKKSDILEYEKIFI